MNDHSLHPNILYRGSIENPLEPLYIQAGPLSAYFEPATAFLRFVKYEEHEILRGVYAAVRDHNWGTVAPQISELIVETQMDSFSIRFDVTCTEGNIHFDWSGVIEGRADGSVSYRMEGFARTNFLRNRIGFCVLHPMHCAGKAVRVTHSNEDVEEGKFPEVISPHQPFKDIRAIAHEYAPGDWAHVEFSGDVFEMEDQRNWTDASFKTYCTPLELPFPAEVVAGERIKQSVSLFIEAQPKPVSLVPKVREEFIHVQFSAEEAVPLPALGLGAASQKRPLQQMDVERLRRLDLHHVRLDLSLKDDSYMNELLRVWQDARQIEAALKLALFLSDNAENELNTFVNQAQEIHAKIDSFILFHEKEKTISQKWIELAKPILKKHFPDIPVGGGTNAYFTELNRQRPPFDFLDFACFSLNPQVHAFDNTSLAETLEAQYAVMRSAQAIAPKTPYHVGPVTLQPRFNPNATGPEPVTPAGHLPPQVDVRQMSLFGAAWTVGSVKYLAQGGAKQITYYETNGWRGVMETEEGCSVPEQFHSLPGCVFPMYFVFADLAEYRGGEVLKCHSAKPLRVDALVLRKKDRVRILLANLTAHSQHVILESSLLSEYVRVRRINAMNVTNAIRSPEEFCANPGLLMQTHNQRLQISLLPYATVRVDLEVVS